MVPHNLKQFVNSTSVGRAFYRQCQQVYVHWLTSKAKNAPASSAEKQRHVLQYAKKSGAKVLIETGTFRGDMVAACLRSFTQIFTIEIDDTLAKGARARFRSEPSVTVLHGNSADLMPDVLKQVSQPCVFWLDGHYSGGITGMGDEETPILRELSAIFQSPTLPHMILIDDARLFDGSNGYPTLEGLTAYVEKSPYQIQSVENDIICAALPKS